jgi:Nucleotidyltransferase domain
MKDPKATVLCLYKQQYSNAIAIFWAGSVTTGNYTGRSDLDLVVIFEHVPNAYREAFVYEDWKVDTFIHDLETLRYFFEEIDGKSGMPALPQMILTGILITPPSTISEQIKCLAQKTMDAGPPPWSKEQLDRARFFITDLLDDILCPQNRAEQLASTAKLYDLLAEFYFRAQNKWQASGKTILHSLKKQDYYLFSMYRDAFDELFKHNHTQQLEKLVLKILAPHGGLLWEGYHAMAPKEWRRSD